MKKTIIVASAAILVVAALFFGIRYFRTGSLIPPDDLPPPPSIQRSLTPLSEKEVVAYWANAGAIYLVGVDGRISKLDGTGESFLMEQAIPEIDSVVASPDKTRLLVSFGPSSAPTYSLYDISGAKWSPLPQGTVAASWSPDGKEVAYLAEGGSQLALGTVSSSGVKKSELARFSGGDFSLAWVTQKKIYLKNKPSARYPVELWSFDIAKRALDPLLLSEPGLTMKWSAPGSSALTFVNSVEENRLSLTNGDGKLIGTLPFATLPEKCVFSGERSGYCAVPTSIPGGTLLPDDFLTGKTLFSDRIVRWSLDGALTVSEVYSLETVAIDAVHLTLEGKKIRFIDRYDRKLYEIEAPEN